jgi:VanZ like protein
MFDDDVWRYMPLGPVPSLALATVGAVAAIYVAVVRSRATRAIAVAMLVASVMIILAYTARGALSNDDEGFSWRLGESIRAELRSINRSLGLLNVFGNVALFMPTGWLVAVLSGRRPILVGTLCALLLSTSVEVWQMASGSFGDVDDLVLNGLGGFLGAGAATFLRWRGARSMTGGSEVEASNVPA